MFETLVLFALAGCLLGVVSGLLPGLHVNTLGLLVSGLAFLDFPEVVALIVSMTVVHSFLDFVPSILLGAPSEDSALSVLPGHRFLAKGRGMEAIGLTVVGGVGAGTLALFSVPLFLPLAETVYAILRDALGFVLLGVVLVMVAGEKGNGKKIAALGIILLCGILGKIVLQGLSVRDPLFLSMAGFFGAAGILQSLREKSVFPEQKLGRFRWKALPAVEGSLLSFLAGACLSLLPAVGPTQAALVVRKAWGKMGQHAYLVLLGGINTANLILSFFVLYALGKTRSGTAAALQAAGVVREEHLILFAGAMILGIAFAALFTLPVARWFLERAARIPYFWLNAGILFFLGGMAFFVAGLLGLLVLFTCSMVGWSCILLGVKRSNCMGFLILPTLFYYLGFA